METVYANGMMNGTNGQAEMAAAQSVLNWNPNQLDIKTKSVEKTLEPLVMQVCICIYQCCQILFFYSNANFATLFQILKLNIPLLPPTTMFVFQAFGFCLNQSQSCSSLLFQLGHYFGLIQISSEEKGKIQKSLCFGSRCRKSYGQFR